MYVSFTYVVSLLCQCVCISADDAILFVTFSFYCEMLLCMLALCHCLSTAAAKFRYVKECFFSNDPQTNSDLNTLNDLVNRTIQHPDAYGVKVAKTKNKFHFSIGSRVKNKKIREKSKFPKYEMKTETELLERQT